MLTGVHFGMDWIFIFVCGYLYNYIHIYVPIQYLSTTIAHMYANIYALNFRLM